MIWGLRRGCLIGPASRFTAGASGFLNFSQSGERPDLFSLGRAELFATPTVARQARERIERGEGSR